MPVRFLNHRVRYYEHDLKVGNSVTPNYRSGALGKWIVYDDQKKEEVIMTLQLDNNIDPTAPEISARWHHQPVTIMCAQHPKGRYVRLEEEI